MAANHPTDAGRQLQELHDQIRACRLCGLHQTRTQAVPGTGPCPADIMIVGEAPGFNEDMQGRPFVGAAGKLLDTLLSGIGLDRGKVYITNVLKCRPPQNRDPMPHEAEACEPYLKAQMERVNPQLVLILGRHALERLLPGQGSISRLHGSVIRRGGITYMPLYHPAAALRNPSLLGDLERAFDGVRRHLDQASHPQPSVAPASPAPTPVPEPSPQLELDVSGGPAEPAPPPAPRPDPEQLTLL